ncbi:MAG: alpha/beta hydrolase [Actinobacteria bacterium]|nr:alpha/beta hydrolase [Actinomycetota bacterium]
MADVGNRIRLRHGRSLAYAEWGDLKGLPVFFFHGSPGSRLFCPKESVTAACRVRLITVDRPGYGRSDLHPGRNMLDWPDDVAALADALAIEEFAITGHSSGGPYALACALKLAGRVTAVGLVSTVVPLDEIPEAQGWLGDEERHLVDVARRDPDQAAKSIAESAQWLLENPELFLEAPRPEPDKRLLADPEVRTMFVEMLQEAVRNGVDGYVWDEIVERNPWGFSLEDIEMKVHIWHGDEDQYIPRAHVESMANLIPNPHPTFYAAQAHGVVITRWNEILTQLASSRP